MNKNRFIKTALCMVLAFAMTFAPVMSSCAMIATALTGEPATEDNSADMMDTNIDSTDQPYLDQSEEGISNDETITEEELVAQEAATGDAQEDASEESSVEEENAQPTEETETETPEEAAPAEEAVPAYAEEAAEAAPAEPEAAYEEPAAEPVSEPAQEPAAEHKTYRDAFWQGRDNHAHLPEKRQSESGS